MSEQNTISASYHPWLEKSSNIRISTLFRQDQDWSLLESFLEICAKNPEKYESYLHAIGLYIDSGEYSALFSKPSQDRLNRMLCIATTLEKTHPQFQMVYHLLMFQGFHFPTNCTDLNLDLDNNASILVRGIHHRMLEDKKKLTKRGNGWMFESISSTSDNNPIRLSINTLLLNTIEWLYGRDIVDEMHSTVKCHIALETQSFSTSCTIHAKPYGHWLKTKDVVSFTAPWLALFDQIVLSKTSNAYSLLECNLHESI